MQGMILSFAISSCQTARAGGGGLRGEGAPAPLMAVEEGDTTLWPLGVVLHPRHL